MIAAIHHVLSEGMAKYTSVPPERRAMQSASAAWAIYGAVKVWLNTPDHRSSEEIVPEILAIVAPLLGDPLEEQHAASPAGALHESHS
jgi:hypothetical protein